MRVLAAAIWLCIGAATASQATPCATATCGLHAAPAPVIGAGIPAFLVVGGVLLGATLIKRWRRS
jgi:hypothetical protein